jgi:hypothetical protein
MATNPDDAKRDKILRFLYERHKTTRGINKIPIGIQELQREMKKCHEMKQQEVSSNLDYLWQAGWVRDVTTARSFTTPGGMALSREQVKWKISEIGINHLQAGTMFKKPESTNQINITNIQGVTVVGDGNIVNTEFTDLFRALDDLDKAIAQSKELSDEQKLDAAGDLSTIQTQIAKKNPNHGIIKTAWESLQVIATVTSVAEAVAKVGSLILAMLS